MLVAMLWCLPSFAGEGEGAREVRFRHLDAVPDLVAGEPSPPPPPQQIGGVLVGERFDREGFVCDDAGAVCVRPHRWDGLIGELRVDTCGDIAQRVAFHVMFARDGRRARRMTARVPSSHAVPNPEERAIEALAVFLSPVAEWERQPPEYAEAEGARIKLSALVSPSGQRRIITSSLGKGRAWFGSSWVVGTLAEADTPCPTGAAEHAEAP